MEHSPAKEYTGSDTSQRLHRILSSSVVAGGLVALLGGISWATGRPFVFPSLGPTAFALALRPNFQRARAVIGGHFCGVFGGLVAYYLLAHGLTLTALPAPGSWAGLRLAASAALSVGFTTGAMIATKTVHSPACATTLIVSLGVLSSPLDGVVIMGAVVLLYGFSATVRHLWSPHTQPAS